MQIRLTRWAKFYYGQGSSVSCVVLFLGQRVLHLILWDWQTEDSHETEIMKAIRLWIWKFCLMCICICLVAYNSVGSLLWVLWVLWKRIYSRFLWTPWNFYYVQLFWNRTSLNTRRSDLFLCTCLLCSIMLSWGDFYGRYVCFLFREEVGTILIELNH